MYWSTSECFFIKHKNVLFLFRKTKVFMKYYHLDQLSDVFQRMGVSAIKIQKGKLLMVIMLVCSFFSFHILSIFKYLRFKKLSWKYYQFISKIYISFLVIRGFLGRQEYRRRLAKARNEAERLKHLADDIYNLNIHLCNQLQIAKQNDTKIPDSKYYTSL